MYLQINGNRRRTAALSRGAWLAGVLLLLVLAASGLTTATRVSAQSAQAKDFFGTVASVSATLLTVATDSATVGVVITSETRVRLPLKPEARATDLAPGDRVAVSLTERNGRLVADKVFLVPEKPRFRHVPGTVTGLGPQQITIQPMDFHAEPLIFAVSPSTPVRVQNAVITLAAAADAANADTEGLVGRFVVMNFALRGSTPPQVIEILVTEGAPPLQSLSNFAGNAPGTLALEAPQQVELKGVFGGVDAAGLWLISGSRVMVGPETTVDGGVVVGQALRVKAWTDQSGLFRARVIEREEAGTAIAQRVRLDGVFQGIDTQGRWVISGNPVAVGAPSHTDELPYPGQRVRVLAIRQEDGTLLAREVENRPQGPEDLPNRVSMRGLLEGIDSQGKWTVSGIKVSVGPGTKLDGSPVVGQAVQVVGLRQEDGSLLAQHIEGQSQQVTPSRGQAKLVGPVEQVLDNGSLVVNGVTVALSALTEQEGNPQVGNLVVVEAALLGNNTLLAREVHLGRDAEVLSLTPVRESEIRGVIQQVNLDATLVVGGVTVVVGALTESSVALREGVMVKVEGVLQADGSLLAREVSGEGRRDTRNSSQFLIDGPISEIQRDAQGNPVGVVVAGSRVSLEALTRLEGSLEEGKDVAVRGIIQDGRFLASRIGEGNPEKSQAKTREIQLEGRVESLWRDPRGRVSRISVNGLVVSISGNTTLSGPLSGGELVAVRGQRQAGGLTATEIQVRPPEAAQAPRTSFRIQGVVAEVQKDSKGKLRGLVLDGKAIVLEGLIQVDRRVAVGAVVDVRGVMAGEVYVASLVKVVEQPKANGENRQQENSQGRRNDRRQDRDEEPDQNGNGGKGGE